MRKKKRDWGRKRKKEAATESKKYAGKNSLSLRIHLL